MPFGFPPELAFTFTGIPTQDECTGIGSFSENEFPRKNTSGTRINIGRKLHSYGEIADALGRSKADVYRVAATLGCQSDGASTGSPVSLA